MSTSPHVTIVNPLAGALRHYAGALRSNLIDSGHDVSMIDVDEPSRSDGSRLGWVRRYVTVLFRLRRATPTDSVILAWPVLGFWDLVVARIILGRRTDTRLIMHDPVPLVRAVGYSAGARVLGRLFSTRDAVIVHSTTAQKALTDAGYRRRAPLVAHPLRATRHACDIADSSPRSRRVIRVLGQYKADRDLQLLADLASALGEQYRLEIHGRGWPSVAGWTVTDGFVDEDRLDHLLATAAAVLIPYRRFYQSGIAIRSFELGTPFVGPECDALAQLYGADSPLLVRSPSDSAAWVDAIELAASECRETLRQRAASATVAVSNAWRHELARQR